MLWSRVVDIFDSSTMEESRLRLFVMNQILDEGMDETHYPLYDAIVSTADWFMIFAHVVSFSMIDVCVMAWICAYLIIL